MCGLAGIWAPGGRYRRTALERYASSMAETLAHRGPDGAGVWVDPEVGLALGHRRLAILDLSPAAAQPMHSASGRLTIVYNGEIYNFRELRAELATLGAQFRGHGDTEVILAACEHWGAEGALRRFNGMFAFALWDRETRRLSLARDRIGIKPLYWGYTADGVLLFGSELKALYRFPRWSPELDRDALVSFLRFNYIPTPRSVFRGIRKLVPGTLLELQAGAEPRISAYWTLAEAVDPAPLQFDEHEAEEQLDRLLGDAVRRRMIADVPVGAFLSGGVDSSTVVALMQASHSRPVRTFSIGFNESGFDEAPHARAVAEHLGTEHHEIYVSAEQAREVIPSLPDDYDEPFADVSQIPTLLVSRLTRSEVTVSLSGDGGDELFAGYNRYLWGLRIRRWLGPLPTTVPRLLAFALRGMSPAAWQGIAPFIPGALRPVQLADKAGKLADLLRGGVRDEAEFYTRLVSFWPDPAALVRGGGEPESYRHTDAAAIFARDFVSRMQRRDLLTYLPDDILTKVDRASMSVGLEARVPLLDHRVVEFAGRLPVSLKLRGGETKWLLRRVLYRYVPRTLIERPKMGFGVPIDRWLRGPLRDWAEGLLEERRLDADGILDPRALRQRWTEHLSGRRNWQYALWGVLMFQAWKRRWLDSGEERSA